MKLTNAHRKIIADRPGRQQGKTLAMKTANAFEIAAQQHQFADALDAQRARIQLDDAVARQLRDVARLCRSQANAKGFERQFADLELRDQVREHRRIAAALDFEARDLER